MYLQMMTFSGAAISFEKINLYTIVGNAARSLWEVSFDCFLISIALFSHYLLEISKGNPNYIAKCLQHPQPFFLPGTELGKFSRLFFFFFFNHRQGTYGLELDNRTSTEVMGTMSSPGPLEPLLMTFALFSCLKRT